MLFANDTDHLILAQASLNRQKGAKGINGSLQTIPIDASIYRILTAL